MILSYIFFILPEFGLHALLVRASIGSFRSRQRAGRPWSAEHAKQDRLNVALGHRPEVLKVKWDCVVCSKYGPGSPSEFC